MILTFIVLFIISLILYQIIGNLVFYLIGILFLVFIIWLWWKKYRPVVGYTMLITGAPGTGKTKLMTQFALYRYRLNKFLWKCTPKYRRGAKPVLCSNYPIVVGKKKRKDYKREFNQYLDDYALFKKNIEKLHISKQQKKLRLYNYKKQNKPLKQLFSVNLKPSYILLHEKLPYNSVYAISEFGSLINNQDYSNPYAKVNVDEWARFIRQYGYSLYADDQSSDNVEVHVRRKFNKLYNLQNYIRIWGLGIGITFVRHMSISEDIKVIEMGQSEDMKKNVSWLPLFWWFKDYDSKAFSNRIKTVPDAKLESFKSFKTNYIPVVPVVSKGANYVKPKTNTKD